MGNCLKITNVDDISLLRGGSGGDLSSGTHDINGRSGSLGDVSGISGSDGGPQLLQSVFLQNLNNAHNTTHYTTNNGANSSSIGGIASGANTTIGSNLLNTIQQQYQHHQLQQYQQQQLPEEEQIRIAKRIGLIQHLPIGTYDGGTTKSAARECVICMIDFCINEPIRYLPCMHAYHVRCIDDWLMRSLTCPSCMVPVDAALLLISFET